MQRLAITWFGHSTFLVRTPGGRRLLFDPWLSGNPSCPPTMKTPPGADAILVSHGHRDHIGDLVACARASGAPVIAAYELCEWLGRKGVTDTRAMNKGGSLRLGDLRVTMTDARHSSGYVEDDGRVVYMGEAAGYVIELEDGMSIYYAGDTSLFSDMKLVGELFKPAIAFLPIGDRFTMDPRQAAMACAWLGVAQVVPMHWGTFPLLTGTRAELKALVGPRVQVLELQPGETTE